MPDPLEEDIRATAPRPDDAFVARLEARVEAGFPEPAEPRRRRRRLRVPSWLLGPVAPVAASVLLVAGVGSAVVLSGSDDDAGSGAGDSTSLVAPAAEEGAAAPDSAAGDAARRSEPAPGAGPSPVAPATSAPGGAEPVAPGRTRSVERRTAIEIATAADDFAETTAGVLRVADSTGTIVQRSDVTEQDGRGYATYDLRVPASRLDEALRRLSELGDVRSRTASEEDITRFRVSAQDRLEDARDERRALLRALERADSEAERDRIRARLRAVRADTARAESDLERVRARTNRAQVSVTVRSTGESGAWTPGDALDDAARILEVVAGVALVTAAILLPLVLVGAAAGLAVRAARRRRRNAVLG
jgi:hypothetical protein